MDRDHRLDAPDNDALQNVEQLSDRSELTTIYPRARNDLEGVELVSREERDKKLSDEQLRISLSLRKSFLPIGLLIPLPFVIIALLSTLTANYINLEKLGFLLLPLLIVVGALIFASYRGFKYAYKIFYTHGVKGWPFIFILLSLLAMSLHGTFLLTEPLHTGEEWIDMLVIAGSVLITSVFYSLLLVFIWSSPRLTSGLKLACAGVLALLILIGTSLFYVL